jgi:asparagine synthase (glutamine-hydrolysing)
VLLSHKAVSRGYFRRAAIERLLDDHADGTAQHGERLWALVMLELWHQLYILPQIEVQV